MSIQSADYTLSDDVVIRVDVHDSITVPKGSFLKPFTLRWVPKHVKERWPFHDDKVEVFCYTKYGILPLPRAKVCKV